MARALLVAAVLTMLLFGCGKQAEQEALEKQLPAPKAEERTRAAPREGRDPRHEPHVYRAVAFTPDGKAALVGDKDGYVAIWDLDSPRQRTTLDCLNRPERRRGVHSVAVTPDGKRGAAGGYKRIDLWDLTTGKELHQLGGHESEVESVTFSPDGRRLASCGQDWTVRVWEVEAGKELFVLEDVMAEPRRVAFSPDGKVLLVANYRRALSLFSAESGRFLRDCEEDPRGGITGGAFSPTGRYAASVGGTGAVRLYEVATGKPVLKLDGHKDVAWALAFCPDGRLLTAGGSSEGGDELRMWDLRDGRLVKTFKIDRWCRGARAVAVSPDGRRALSGGCEVLILWDLETGAARRLIDDRSKERP